MKQHSDKAVVFTAAADSNDDDGEIPRARLLVWNEMLRTHLELASVAIFPPGPDAPLESAGGNIWRDTLALHILHQTEILK